IPTWMRYGVLGGGAARNIHLHAISPVMILSSLARFLSFASLEINRFIATDGAKRVEFFRHHLWLIPFAAVVWIAGIVQPLWMLVELLRRRRGSLAWRTMRHLVAASMLIVYASYWFVMEPAQAHAFYVLAPIAFLLAAYCWAFIDGPRWRIAAAALLAVNVAFHAGLAVAQLPELSLYKNRGP